MGQKNNPNGFRHTGLDINPVANYKMLFQKRLIQKKYIEGVYRNYTLGNVLEKDNNTWVVEYSKLPKKTSALDKENVLKLKNLTIIERKLADNENATVIANSLKKEFSINLKKTLQKNKIPDNGCHLISKGRHNGAEIANQEEYGKRLPMQTIKSPIQYAYKTALTKYGLISLKVSSLLKTNNK